MIFIWTIVVSVISLASEINEYGFAPVVDRYQLSAIAGIIICVGILTIMLRQLQTKQIIKKVLNGSQLLSIFIGTSVGIALFLTLKIFNFPFSLPYGSLSGFTAGLTLCKLKNGAKRIKIKEVFVVGFLTYFIVLLLLTSSRIVFLFPFLGSENQILLFISYTGTGVLGAALWGTLSSLAGYLIPKVERRFILASILALGIAFFFAQITTQIVGDYLLGATQAYQMLKTSLQLFSLEGFVREIPSIIGKGVILACFLSIFQRKSVLKKINKHVNLSELSLSIKFLMASIPFSIKILIGYGILGSLISPLYRINTSNWSGIYLPWGLVSILVLAGTFLLAWSFLKKPTTEKGILLFGFTIASDQAISLLFLGLSSHEGLLYVMGILVQIFFVIITSSWIYWDKLRKESGKPLRFRSTFFNVKD